MDRSSYIARSVHVLASGNAGRLKCLGFEAEVEEEANRLIFVLEYGRVVEDPLADASQLVADCGVDRGTIRAASQERLCLLEQEAELLQLGGRRSVPASMASAMRVSSRSRRPGRMNKRASIRPMDSCLTAWNSGCAWKTPAGNSSLVMFERKMIDISYRARCGSPWGGRRMDAVGVLTVMPSSSLE